MKRGLKILLTGVMFCCPLCFAQCKKDRNKPKPDNPYGLPNATQTGAGVFACRINGTNFIAKNNINSIGAWMSPQKDTLTVFGEFAHTFFQHLTLGSIQKDRKINKTYYLEDTLNTSIFYSTDSTCEGGGSSVTNVFKVKGSIIYTKLDTVDLIVSGTFNCSIPIPNCEDLKITDGRFDVHYHY
jgi:hypothetical protein